MLVVPSPGRSVHHPFFYLVGIIKRRPGTGVGAFPLGWRNIQVISEIYWTWEIYLRNQYFGYFRGLAGIYSETVGADFIGIILGNGRASDHHF